MKIGLCWTYLLFAVGVSGRFSNAHPRSILPPKVLHPTYPPGHNPFDLQHLIPRLDHSLYFAEKGKKTTDPTAFGSLNATLIYPTVILDHSAHIQSVDCSADGLTICFNEKAREVVHKNWDLKLENSPVIISPHFPGCGRYYQGERTYWQIISSQLEYNKKECIHAKTKEITFPSIIQGGNLRFGHFEAHKGSSIDDQSQRGDLKDVQDISNNEDALHRFFGERPSTSFFDTGLASQQIMVGETGPVYYWGIDLGDLFHRTTTVFAHGLSWIGDKLPAVRRILQDFKELGKFIRDPLGYEWSLSHSHSWSYNIGATNTLLPGLSPIFGAGSGLLLASDSALSGKLQFDNCYAKGSFAVTGDISFSLHGGVDKAELDVGFDLDSRLAMSITLEEKANLIDYKKEIVAWNLLELEIPQVISIGPQLSLNAVVNLSASKKSTIEVGGSLKIDHTRAKLDLKQLTGSIDGFRPGFTPIANAQGGSSSVTLSFGLPLGLELGIDAFGGKWRAEVGLYDKISAEATAQASAEKDCPGVSIDLGVKNKIYLGIPTNPSIFTIDERTLLSKNPICIRTSSSNFNTLGLQQFETLLSEKNTAQVIYMKKPKTMDLQDPFTRIRGMQGKMLTDRNQTAALYVGKGDRLYLVPAYDPTILEGASFQYFPDISDSLFIRDGYGGFLNIDPEEMHSFGMSSLRSSRLTQMPANAVWVVLLEVAVDEPGEAGTLVALDRDQHVLLSLVACHAPKKGVRVYLGLSENIEDLIGRLNRGELDKFIEGEGQHCQPVHLTSHTTGFRLDQ
ncbi:hypothetical protein ETB97_009471 [Aspergillus alliaceus]|uniref:Uncharacterized protein n=1 Tax=Petromyces alliaceus TaxID=209559 RepID=A0A8H6E0N7_PETAA|nr:hypothetical protein ETB97_009471 [Aspergillus burnettii]